MSHSSAVLTTGRLDDRGVALPLAILGLIFVTFLFAGLLFTSGTEAAIGSAHQDAVESLHSAEGAIHTYIRDVASDRQTSLVPGTHQATFQRNGRDVTFGIQVSRLSYITDDLPGEEGEADFRRLTETFSILSRQDGQGAGAPRGSRQVGALVEGVRIWPLFEIGADGGVTAGAGGLRVTGSAQISAYSAACADSTGVGVRLASDADEEDVDLRGGGDVEGGIEHFDEEVNTADMVQHILGGATFDQVARMATIKFEGEDGLVRNANVYSDGRPLDHMYNWGCPEAFGANCGTPPQEDLRDPREYFPIIYIDASDDEARIQNLFGQGVLLVRGDLRITGQFSFAGIVVVDGGFTIAGTGGEQTIEGALVATGGVDDERSNMSGNALVRLNRCLLEQLEEQYQQQGYENVAQQFEGGPFGWFEVVR